MNLSQIVSATGLATFPIVSLVIFFVVFVAVAMRVFPKSRKAEFQRIARAAITDGQHIETHAQPSSNSKGERS